MATTPALAPPFRGNSRVFRGVRRLTRRAAWHGSVRLFSVAYFPPVVLGASPGAFGGAATGASNAPTCVMSSTLFW